MKNYYNILEVSHHASYSLIKSAYRKLAKEWHPDVNQGCEIAENWFREIQEAYETLSDIQKKSLYDFKLKRAILANQIILIKKPKETTYSKTATPPASSLEDYQKRINDLMQKHQNLVEKNKKMAEYYRTKEQKAKTFYDDFRENREKSFQQMKENLTEDMLKTYHHNV